MELLIFSIFDQAAGAFLPPFFVPTVAIAQRQFKQAANDATHSFAIHARDYTLFELGSFDQAKGNITTHPSPISHGLALTYITEAS